jgi:hypothetical protein
MAIYHLTQQQERLNAGIKQLSLQHGNMHFYAKISPFGALKSVKWGMRYLCVITYSLSRKT